MNHDVVYILGSGSNWNDNELRYSLRSLERHFEHDRVFIVGERPDWLQNIIHIEAPDSFPGSSGKMKNAVRKIKTACEDDRISESFVLMNDDFYFLKDCPEILPYSLGTISDAIDRHRTKRGHYYDALRNTRAFLYEAEEIDEPIFYGVHYPIVYEKKKFLRMFESPRLPKVLYSCRTMYGNIFDIGNIVRKDPKITSLDEFDRFLSSEDTEDFLSSDNRLVLHPRFQEWIERRFPDQSKYEKERTPRRLPTVADRRIIH